ncbi:MAG: hypothetical protein D6768_08215 [Chloroflexi bacterium]|nr:MAG: hypothetical protein D6768_08215 [Chloroflexota bacterium]
MWAGLLRLGWPWPVLQPTLPVSHGPLMISGFLGTVIGVERAVALNRRWTYIGPLLTGVGGVLLIAGVPGLIAPLLLTAGSLMLVAVFGLILSIETARYTVVMALGALVWFIGNVLWLLGWPIYTLVYFWAGFLILTIAGERLELGRILRYSNAVQRLFLAAVALFLLGLVASLVHYDAGVRLCGAALLGLAAWFLRFDVARYTVRKSGLTRFIAVCLLTGYGWLAVAGLLAMVSGGQPGGLIYDATQHAIFVGFVMSMIFGHAPIIFPAVLGKPVQYSPVFYSHLALLHLSLLLRVAGDLATWLPGHQWGGLLNVLAILLFVANTVRGVRAGARQP